MQQIHNFRPLQFCQSNGFEQKKCSCGLEIRPGELVKAANGILRSRLLDFSETAEAIAEGEIPHELDWQPPADWIAVARGD
jgi:hypothetical protein